MRSARAAAWLALTSLAAGCNRFNQGVLDATSVGDAVDTTDATSDAGVDAPSTDVPAPLFVFQFVGGALTTTVPGGPSAQLQFTWSGMLTGSSDGGGIGGGPITFQGTIQ